MRLVIDDVQRLEIRAGLRARQQQLQRLRENAMLLPGAARALDERLDVIQALLRATATEDELAEMQAAVAEDA